jgi:hypothetical protein
LYRVMIQGLLSVNRERCSGRRPGHLGPAGLGLGQMGGPE